jgi:hypothetical protein
MAATVVNSVDKLPTSIIVAELKSFIAKGISSTFLDELLTPIKNGIGIKRHNYYMIDTNAVMRYKNRTSEFVALRTAMDYAVGKNFKYIMVVCP